MKKEEYFDVNSQAACQKQNLELEEKVKNLFQF